MQNQAVTQFIVTEQDEVDSKQMTQPAALFDEFGIKIPISSSIESTDVELRNSYGALMDLGDDGEAWAWYKDLGGCAIGEMKIVVGPDYGAITSGGWFIGGPVDLPQDQKLHMFSADVKVIKGTPTSPEEIYSNCLLTGGDLSSLFELDPGTIPANYVVADFGQDDGDNIGPLGPLVPFDWSDTGGFIHCTFVCGTF